MDGYAIKRIKTRKVSALVGAVLTLAVHGALVAIVILNGMTYIWPPAQEQPILLDFSEVQQTSSVSSTASPVAPAPVKTEPEEIVQKSQAPDPRASFPGMVRRPVETVPKTETNASDKSREGQLDGNSDNASPEGRSNAKLQGRRVVGNLIKPRYQIQKSGVVVVKIVVDMYGNVTSAQPGMPGTTLDDKNLWDEARIAALKTHFTPVSDVENAPPVQEGTITYIFNLK